MQLLKIVSRLLDYPTAELQQHAHELTQIIQTAREISPDMRIALESLVSNIVDQDIMDAQETYGSLFDRGRALSLLLFEHVHGESRDRGQAMVDLMAQYEAQGFNINVRELPDYIPLYLEYLSQRPDLEAREGLADIAHILGMLSARLQERGSLYHILFDCLLMISGAKINVSDLLKIAAEEERDDTPEALDKIWEEEAVTFAQGDKMGDCGQTGSHPAPASSDQAVPIRWVDPVANATHPAQPNQ